MALASRLFSRAIFLATARRSAETSAHSPQDALRRAAENRIDIPALSVYTVIKQDRGLYSV